MCRSFINRFAKNESAAIAPMYALGIGTLIVMSAVGFDYGRLMALDTELQNAADQAALAAATQLDGSPNAMINARNAATNTFASSASQFTNQTRFANDGGGRPITSLTYRFFNGYTNDAMGTLLTNDNQSASAKVVEVTVNARRVFYALTPLVGAVTSGNVIGRALAGLETATCNVPPLMFCVPDDPITGTADRNFPTAGDIGKGMLLHFKQNITGKDEDEGVNWAPGNFGFLDVPYGSASDKNRKLGLNSATVGCFGEDVESRTGFRVPEADALNTRLDLYSSPLNPNSCDQLPGGNGDFCPSANTRKDWVREESHSKVKGSDLAALACNDPGLKPSDIKWINVSSAPTATNPGYPMDTCFGSTCSVLGTGAWNGDSWMAATHGGLTTSAVPDADGNGSISRYEVYLWELTDPANRLGVAKVGDNFPASPDASTKYDVKLYCSYPQPMDPDSAVPSSSTQKDRRVLTAAAVDCTELNGHGVVDIVRWTDLFLVKPTATTGGDEREFFTEIIGPARKPNGDLGFQYFGRNKAVLIR